MSLKVDILQGGTNNHGVTVDDFNALQTDILSDGIVGTISNTGGVAPMTGGFALNAQGTPDMTVAVTAGVAYVTGTPTSGVSQRLRVKLDANQNVTIPSNSTGGTRYDWIYIKLDADKMKDPAVDASDVATLVAVRSTSASTQSGTAPTYGLLLGIVTVANGAVSITNASIHDDRDPIEISNVVSAVSPWAIADSLTYAGADSPTFTATASGDLRSKYYPGVRLKLEQTQALSHYWTFNTNSTPDVGSATMGNIGTPTYTAGKFGNALTLNGTNQALSITDATAFHLGENGANFTIGVWFKTSATGTVRYLFQNYSQNSNTAGVAIAQNGSNTLSVWFGNNTGTGVASALTGTTTITDGNWHQAVLSFSGTGNNFAQLYLDSKLEASGYMVTPVYAATTYPRIGCSQRTPGGGNIEFFSGQIDDLFLINGYALDEQTIKAKYDAATAQGTGDITLTKYFLCTASSYSAPNTTITMYGGTDHALSNATISNSYYSTQDCPYGFPKKDEKWTVTGPNTSGSANKNGPSAGVWYGHANALSNGVMPSISVPIGSWELYYATTCGAVKAGNTVDPTITLSRSNSSDSDSEFKASAYGLSTFLQSLSRKKDITASVKTVWYMLMQTNESGVTSLSLYDSTSYGNTTLKAKSNLL